MVSMLREAGEDVASPSPQWGEPWLKSMVRSRRHARQRKAAPGSHSRAPQRHARLRRKASHCKRATKRRALTNTGRLGSEQEASSALLQVQRRRLARPHDARAIPHEARQSLLRGSTRTAP